MDANLSKWVEENKLTVSESSNDGLDVVTVDGFGELLYIHKFENDIIDEDFSFILSDEEFDALDEGKFQYILFEFGGKFYYSGLKKSKNDYNEIIYKPEFNDFKYIGVCSEKAVLPFSHIGIHDEYEIMNGSGSCSLWAKKAKFLGIDTIGTCNKNTLANVISFNDACKKNKLKPIFGETITVAYNYDKDKDIQETFDLKIYITEDCGWKNMLYISKLINVDYDKFIPFEELSKYTSGLTAVIPKESYLNYMIDRGDLKEAKNILKLHKSIFSTIYYQIDTLEYQSKSLFKKHLNQLDQYLINFKKLVKPILINDSYYLDKEELGVKGMLNKVNGKALPEAVDQYFKSVNDAFESYSDWLDEVEPLFQVIADGINNARKFTESVNFKLDISERKIPAFEVKDVEEKFFTELQKGIEKRLIGKVKDIDTYYKRIETECELIVPNDLCSYFLILWDIINWCDKENIMVGPGRGSVCGSLVAYCLGITQIDPIPYQLYFERFLNKSRVSAHHSYSLVLNDGSEIEFRDGDKVPIIGGDEIEVDDSIDWKTIDIDVKRMVKVKSVKVRKFFSDLPDVDLDFETSGRDKVKNYIKEKYGSDYSCSVGSYTRMKLKTCIKDFAKVKGLSFDLTNKITKDIDDQIEYTWGDLISYASRSKLLYKFVQDNPDIVHMCKYAMMVPKAESVHPSAYIIVPKHNQNGDKTNLYNLMPVKAIDGVLVSEWEGKYTEAGLFLKEDILGLSQLDKFHGIMDLIKKNRGEEIILEKIPFDDKEVFKYFRRGWCEDVFQFGTTGLMGYCRQVKPTQLSDLIAMTALFRPGPMESNAHQDFADIKNGKKKAKYDYGVENITEETYSLLVYQEQMMSIMHQLGGLSLIDAENARKYIKKKMHRELNALGERFIAGAIKNGCPDKEAHKIWDKMNAFSSYSFNKSHAAAYSVVSYYSMWFKVNYPLEFWTISLQEASESEIPYRLAEMKKTGVEIEVRPPDVNYSGEKFSCDPENNRIFYNLNKIKGCGDIAVSNIVEVRDKDGEFFSIDEFVQRVPSKVNKSNIKALIISGAFDLVEDLSEPRQRKDLLKKYLVDIKGDEDLPEAYNSADSLTNAFWIMEQKRLTGFGEIDYDTLVRDSIPNKRFAKILVNDLEFLGSREGETVAVAGKFIYYRERAIKNGIMGSLQVDCNNTIINITLWPDAYEKYREEIEDYKGGVIAVSGVVKKDKFRGVKTLYSSDSTKLYLVSQKMKKNTFEKKFGNSEHK